MTEIMKITCPKCGYEYTAAEIYYADSFLGKPTNIIRDADGKIISISGTNMNLKETYICDNCNCNFKVEAKLSFTSKVNKDVVDFEDDF